MFGLGPAEILVIIIVIIAIVVGIIVGASKNKAKSSGYTPPMQMNCPQCGSPLPPGANFCKNCGNHITGQY